MLMALTQVRPHRGPVHRCDNRLGVGLMGHVANSLQGSQPHRRAFLQKPFGMERQSDRGIGSAMHQFDRHRQIGVSIAS